MCYTFTDKMKEEESVLKLEQYGANDQPAMSHEVNAGKAVGGGERKRPAEEELESGRIKIAKVAKDNGGKMIEDRLAEMERQLAKKDETIKSQRATLEKAKTRHLEMKDDISELEEEVDRKTRDCDKWMNRAMKLEARNQALVEANRVVDMSAEAENTEALRKSEAQKKSEYVDLKKQLREKFNTKLEGQKEKDEKERKGLKSNYDSQLKKQQDANKTKVADLNKEIKTLKDTHNKETQALKSKHREEIKNGKPEHSKAMKEKTQELKAKNKEIDELNEELGSAETKIGNLESDIFTLNKEKKDLHDEVRAKGIENKGLRDHIKKQDNAIGQYKSRIVHEGKRWELQKNKAETAENQVMNQQRTNFALRMERDAQGNRIRGLESQLQRAQARAPGLDAATQTVEASGGEEMEGVMDATRNRDGEIQDSNDGMGVNGVTEIEATNNTTTPAAPMIATQDAQNSTDDTKINDSPDINDMEVEPTAPLDAVAAPEPETLALYNDIHICTGYNDVADEASSSAVDQEAAPNMMQPTISNVSETDSTLTEFEDEATSGMD